MALLYESKLQKFYLVPIFSSVVLVVHRFWLVPVFSSVILEIHRFSKGHSMFMNIRARLKNRSVLLCLIDTWPLGLNLPSFFLWVPVSYFPGNLVGLPSCGPSFFLLVPVCSFSGNLVAPLIDDLPLALGCLKIIPAKNCTLHQLYTKIFWYK